MVGVVGITRLHRNGLALFSGRQGVTAASRAVDGLVIGEPLVLHAAARHPILIVDMGGQFATDFCLAADGNRAVLICGRWGNVSRLARRVFVVPGIVFVRRLHGNFVPGVVFTERIGAAVGLVDGLAVAQPLVLHVVSGKAVAVGYGSGEGAAHFRFAADGDAAFVILLWLWRSAVVFAVMRCPVNLDV